MLWLLASAALVASAPADRGPTSAAVQARATVRIISGVRLKLDSPTNPDAPPAHDGVVVATDGSRQPARLIEFE
jgi:hypothetical protein